MNLYRGPTYSALLRRALSHFPDRVALSWDGGSLTYAATADRIGCMQAVLLAAGLSRGSRVAILAGNSPDAWCASMAAQACGMSVSCLNALGSAEDHLFQLQDYGADLLIVQGGNYYAQTAERVLARRPSLRTMMLGASLLGPDLVGMALSGASHNMRDLSGSEDVALINYTGGTTGKSKGVIRSQLNMGEVTRAILETIEFPIQPSFLAATSISHVTGTMILPVLARGGCVHLLDRFTPDKALHTITKERISVTLLVPTMIYALLDEPSLTRANLDTLETVIYSASPIAPARLQEGLERLGPIFSQVYGQTEGFPLTYLSKADHTGDPGLLGSCGAASMSSTLALLDADDHPVPMGEAGEICARASHVMQGYLGRDDLSAETLRGGWLHTGDIARRDERGYHWIVDRKKDMIVTGGFNVYPREVEDVLSWDPAVAEVAVIGVPDPKWGEAVTALVVRRSEVTTDAAELAARLTDLVRTRKGAIHAPKNIEFVNALPRTVVGKLDKRALRQPYWGDRDRQVG